MGQFREEKYGVELQPHESSSETLRALDAITGAVLTSTSREFV